MTGNPLNADNEWLSETQGAYAEARRRIKSTDMDLEDIYFFSAEIASENRGIEDGATVLEMNKLVREIVEEDHALEAASRSRYKFHFVSGYIFAHVAAGLVTEREADRILELVNDELDLFDET